MFLILHNNNKNYRLVLIDDSKFFNNSMIERENILV